MKLRTLSKTHITVGLLGLVAFLLQGQYMDRFHEHLVNMNDAPRMLYRSGHIYVLFASLLNLVLGTYLPNHRSAIHPAVQMLVSAVVLLAPVLLLLGFFLEPGLEDMSRPYSRPALYALFGVGVILSLSAFVRK